VRASLHLAVLLNYSCSTVPFLYLVFLQEFDISWCCSTPGQVEKVVFVVFFAGERAPHKDHEESAKHSGPTGTLSQRTPRNSARCDRRYAHSETSGDFSHLHSHSHSHRSQVTGHRSQSRPDKWRSLLTGCRPLLGGLPVAGHWAPVRAPGHGPCQQPPQGLLSPPSASRSSTGLKSGEHRNQAEEHLIPRGGKGERHCLSSELGWTTAQTMLEG